MTPRPRPDLNALLAPVAKATDSSLVVIDNQFRIAWSSDQASRLIGLTLDDVGSPCPESLQGKICSGGCKGNPEEFTASLRSGTFPYSCLESTFGQIEIRNEMIGPELDGTSYLLKSFRPLFTETGTKKQPYSFVASREWSEPFLEKLTRVAKTEIPVLLIGETGTGKECLARLIHERSRRYKGPFVALDLSVIPETLVEDALFGHQRGAFTGAVSSQSGRLSRAHGGTLFIDEIENIPLAVQTRLLRFLEDGVFEPMGSSQSMEISTRIIAATNEDPEKLLREGRMRPDLFYRLNGLSLQIPPLRMRIKDLPVLIDHFRSVYTKNNPFPTPPFAPETVKALSDYHFPGNIRELKHLVESILAVSDPGKPVYPSDLPESIRRAIAHGPQSISASIPRNSSDDEIPDPDTFTRRRIEKALRTSEGKIAEASRLLGMSRITLWRHMKRLKMKH